MLVPIVKFFSVTWDFRSILHQLWKITRPKTLRIHAVTSPIMLCIPNDVYSTARPTHWR